MDLLNEFIKSETNPKSQQYVKKIYLYYEEKFDENHKNLNRISDNNLIFLISRAKCNHLKEQDVQFLNLMSLFNLIGIALIDDLADDEITSLWEDIPFNTIFNIACQFLFVYPTVLILKSYHLPKAGQVKLMATLAEYYLKISAGEYEQDFNNNNLDKNVTLDSILKAMLYKTGEWNALEAAISLCYLNQVISPDDLFITFARELGLLKQLSNDLGDVFKSENSKDIANGVFNFPIAAYYFSANSEDKKNILAKLEGCRQGTMTTQEFRQNMLDDAQLSFCNLILDAQKNKLIDLVKQMNIPKELQMKFINLVEF